MKGTISKITLDLALLFLLFISSTSILAHATGRFGKQFCSNGNFNCIKIKRGDSWDKLFPNDVEQQLVKKINRLNLSLQPGMILAVPNNLSSARILDFAPFPEKILPSDRNLVMVNLIEQAFAAYNEAGNLVNWGPVSGGNTWCPDVGRSCRTPAGNFHVISKGGPDCISSKYPIPFGGAPMPYCMYFHNGYALHGSPALPGYNASHGCVRLLYEDAYWLNNEFVNIGKSPTRVVITR